jgi:L-alanine-DL-glutamate epimerase-like enolase superfamily enzyme
MAHLAGLADWYDLDPPLLIQNDPFVGIQIDNHGFIKLPEKAGIGVEQRRME